MDLFRFVAATTVVLEHARDLVWIDAPQAGALPALALIAYAVSGLGHEAVMAFFVLSGFWITHAAERKMAEPSFWPAYLIDRLSRLSIVIVPALVLGGLLDWIGMHILHGPVYFDGLGAHSISPDAHLHLTPLIFAGNLLFLQDLAVATFGSNGPLWSLAAEFWYYLWFAALLFLGRRRRLAVPLIAVGAAVAWPQLLPGFAVWLLGSALYYADRAWRRARRASGLGYAGLVAATGLLGCALALSRLQLLGSGLADLCVAGAFTLVLWTLLRSEIGFPNRVLGPLAEYGARASFSLYVVHYPLLALAVSALGVDRRLAPGLGTAALIAGLVVAALVAAWGFAALTEAHTGKLRRAATAALRRSPVS